MKMIYTLSALVASTLGCAMAATRPKAIEVSPQPTKTLHTNALVGPSLISEPRGNFFADMPRGLTSFGSAVVDGAFYLVGGYGGEPHNYTAEGQSRDIWKLPLATGQKFTRVTELPYGLQGLASVSFKDELCIFGGNHVQGRKGEKTSMVSVADAACWHTKTATWRTLPRLPRGRSSLDAVMIGSTVYLAGGWQLGDGTRGGDETSGRWSQDILRMDLAASSPTWTSIEAPMQVRAGAVVASRGKLLLLGGLTADQKTSRAVHVFDVQTSSWSRGPDLPSDGFGGAAITEEPSGHVIASTRDGSLFELEENTWRPIGSLMFPRLFHRLAWLSPSKLVVVGGITGMQTHGRTRLVEVVHIGPREAQVSQVEIAFPGTAKNRQATFVHGDFFYMFGGNTSVEQHDFQPNNFVSEGHRLHLPSLTWASVAPFPEKRQSMQVAPFADHIVALGGFGHNGTAAVSFQEGYVFDPSTEAWSKGSSLPLGRTQFGLTAHDGKLFVFGGLNYDPARSQAAFDHVTTNLVSGANAEGFTDLAAPLPGPRRAFAGVALGEDYFIVGGMREDFKLVDDCLRFSFRSKTYAPMPCPAKVRLSGRLLAIGGKVYAVGGNSRAANGQLEPERSIECFDPMKGQWSQVLADVGTDPHHANIVVYRDHIVMASTQNTRGTMTLTMIRLPQ